MNFYDTIRQNGITPTPVTLDQYWHALGAVPPIRAKGKGFWAMGELYSTTHANEEIYYWFAQIEKKYFAILGTEGEAEIVFKQIEPEEIFSTPCGGMTSEEIEEHTKDCDVCRIAHDQQPLDLYRST